MHSEQVELMGGTYAIILSAGFFKIILLRGSWMWSKRLSSVVCTAEGGLDVSV